MHIQITISQYAGMSMVSGDVSALMHPIRFTI